MIKLISKFFFTSCVLIFTHNYAIAAPMQSLGKGEGALDIVAWAGYISSAPSPLPRLCIGAAIA